MMRKEAKNKRQRTNRGISVKIMKKIKKQSAEENAKIVYVNVHLKAVNENALI